jgi:hypothetical protein
MGIAYTNHAEEKIAERKIPKTTIESALKNPDAVVSGTLGRKIAHRLIRDKLLRIVYEQADKEYIVITAYYTEPDRYRMML